MELPLEIAADSLETVRTDSLHGVKFRKITSRGQIFIS